MLGTGAIATTTVGGAATVGGLATAAFAGGYMVGDAIGQAQWGDQTIHEHLGGLMYNACPWCWNAIF